MPANTHTPPERDKAMKRWIPLDLVQNTAEYLGCVPSLLSFRGVSTGWQGAVSDAVGFLNGRCWTQLGKDGPLWTSLCLDDVAVVARCGLLCLAPRLETLEWRHYADRLDFPLRLLGENNTVLTKLSLEGHFPDDSSTQTTDVSWLLDYHALEIRQLINIYSATTNRHLRPLERALDELHLNYCNFIMDVSCLRNCRALTTLHLSYTGVTGTGVFRPEKFFPTLAEIYINKSRHIHDLGALRNRPFERIIGYGSPSAADIMPVNQ
jgi:hypothetical protein